MANKRRTGPVPWADLSFDQRKHRIRTLRGKGDSDEVIADKLSASKGQIVGFRHRHLPELTGDKRTPADTPPAIEEQPEFTPAVPHPPNAESQISEPPHVEELPRMPAKPRFVAEEVSPDPPKRKVAASEKTQCQHHDPEDRRQCAFEWTVEKRSGKFCEPHALIN